MHSLVPVRLPQSFDINVWMELDICCWLSIARTLACVLLVVCWLQTRNRPLLFGCFFVSSLAPGPPFSFLGFLVRSRAPPSPFVRVPFFSFFGDPSQSPGGYRTCVRSLFFHVSPSCLLLFGGWDAARACGAPSYYFWFGGDVAAFLADESLNPHKKNTKPFGLGPSHASNANERATLYQKQLSNSLRYLECHAIRTLMSRDCGNRGRVRPTRRATKAWGFGIFVNFL